MPNLDKSNPINDMDFSLNNFNEQKIYTGAMAYAHKIKNLLFMRPGDFPSMPEMGINIQSIRYQSLDDLVAGELREKLSDQITKYIMSLPVENIEVSAMKANGDYFLILKFTLTETEQIVYAVQQSKGQLVNFNFKIYETEKVDIW